MLLTILLLIISFYFLGKSADLVVSSLRALGHHYGIKIFSLGILLGLFTSLPEFALGIDAILQDAQSISLGNLLGGIIVLFGLILSISLILNRSIESGKELKAFAPFAALILLPLIFSVDHIINRTEGFFIITTYILFFLFFLQQEKTIAHTYAKKERSPFAHIIYALVGIIFLVLLSHTTLRLILMIISKLPISPFLFGLIGVAIGTNLPELTVIIRAWRTHTYSLSTSVLVGSAAANIFIIGIIALCKPLVVPFGISFLYTAFFLLLLLLGFFLARKTGELLTRKEGFMFLALYCLFLIGQFILSMYA